MEQDAILHITHGACAVLIVKEDAAPDRASDGFFADRPRTGRHHSRFQRRFRL